MRRAHGNVARDTSGSGTLASTSAMDAERSPIDWSELVGRCLGDAQFAKRMLGRFVVEAPAQVKAIEDALVAADVAKATKAAHTLKGTAGNVSVVVVAAIAGELEQLCKSGALAGASDVVRRLNVEIDRSRQAIEALQAGP